MSVEISIHKKFEDFELNIEFNSDARRIGILGASGSGKSMTLKAIAGIIEPDNGHVYVDGNVLYDSEKKVNLKPQEREVGYMFQNYALFPTMSVAKNIAAGVKGTKEQKRQKTADLIREFKLEGLENRLPREISGGQQQRVALARMIASEPKVLLFDEPFSAMDESLKEELRLELTYVLKKYDKTAIIVTHDKDEALQMCDQIIVMDNGKVIKSDATNEKATHKCNITKLDTDLTGWLIVNEYLNTEKFTELQNLFMDAAKVKGIKLLRFTNADFTVGFDSCVKLKAGGLLSDNKPDFVIFYDKDIVLAKAIEDAGIRVYNSSEVIEICDSKVKTALSVAKCSDRICTPKSFKVPFTYENIGIKRESSFGFLDNIETEIGYPMIIKESYSSFGMGVHLAHNRDEAIELLCQYGSKECLIQEYIHTDLNNDICKEDGNNITGNNSDFALLSNRNAKHASGAVDVRLQMVGDKCVAAMMRSNDNDYRANITNGGTMSPYEPTDEDLRLARAVMKCLKLDFAGIDIMFAMDKSSGQTYPVFCEANSNAHFKNLYDLTGINTAEYMIDYIVDKINN